MGRSHNSGFTLIELIIVVAIIAILAAFAVSAYQDYIARSQMSEAMHLASGLKADVTQAFSQTGQCPANETNGIATATDIHGTYVAQVVTGGKATAVGGCTITAMMKTAGLPVSIRGKTLTLSLSNADKGSNVWTCTSNATQVYLPKACAGTGG